MYRLIPGDEFLAKFSSDRRHMRSENGDWLSPPPPWDIIQNGAAGEGTSRVVDNLQKYIEMDPCEEGFGRVLEEREFLEWCGYKGDDTMEEEALAVG